MADRAVRVGGTATVADRREAILLAAGRVIARDGAERLRMAAVAREAGVSSALLHYYFETREELIRQAFELHDQRATERSAVRTSAIADPVERIADALAHELSDDSAVRDGWVLWSEMQRLALFDEDLRASVVDRSARWVGGIAELIAEARDAGALPAEIEAPSAALRLTCLVDGLGAHVAIGSVTREEALRMLNRALHEVLGR